MKTDANKGMEVRFLGGERKLSPDHTRHKEPERHGNWFSRLAAPLVAGHGSISKGQRTFWNKAAKLALISCALLLGPECISSRPPVYPNPPQNTNDGVPTVGIVTRAVVVHGGEGPVSVEGQVSTSEERTSRGVERVTNSYNAGLTYEIVAPNPDPTPGVYWYISTGVEDPIITPPYETGTDRTDTRLTTGLEVRF